MLLSLRALVRLSVFLLSVNPLLASADPDVDRCSAVEKKPFAFNGQTIQRYSINTTKLEALNKELQQAGLAKVDFDYMLAKCMAAPKAPWIVKKAAWDVEDEKAWQQWVQKLGKTKCYDVDTCIASDANDLKSDLDLQAYHYADCADFPLYLRAYFSWKKNLPFTVGAEPAANSLTPAQQKSYQALIAAAQEKGPEEVEKVRRKFWDLRYTVNGNTFQRRVNVSAGGATDFFKISRVITDEMSSASYRMLSTAPGQVLPDFYSPKISTTSIKPGSVLYNTAGHVALIYDVDANGTIYYFDAHPDNSVSRKTWSPLEFGADVPLRGGGFKNWRPFRLEGAQKDPATGGLKGGKVVMDSDDKIPDFSLVQYLGNVDPANTSFSKAQFWSNGYQVNYEYYVNLSMSEGKWRVKPLNDFKRDLEQLCTDLGDRAVAVQKGVDNLAFMNHPSTLPDNIWGSSDATWEQFSSPGRDLRLRTNSLALVSNAKKYIQIFQSKSDPFFQFSGTNLKEELLKIYAQVDSQCRITYKNSKGSSVNMSMTNALERLSRMSFDPYNCAERRWGAKYKTELATCNNDETKEAWYQFTQFLRNLKTRDGGEKFGQSLDEVKSMVNSGQVDNSDHSADFLVYEKLKAL